MKSKFEKFSRPEYIAAISAFIFGLLVHLFSLVNVMHNHDNAHSLPDGYGTGVASGRWFLSICGDTVEKYLGGYNLPFFNGVAALLLISTAAGFLVSTLEIKGSKRAAFTGMIFVCFPSTASILFYRFTSVYYALAVLLAVMGAWVVVNYRYGFVLGPFLIALSLGLYQAFLPITISIFILVLLRQAIEGELKLPKLILCGVIFCAVLIAGLMLYYYFLDVTMKVYQTELGTYKSIDEMGKISLSTLPELLSKAYTGILRLPLDDYAYLARIPLLRQYYAAVGVLDALLVIYMLIARRRNVWMWISAVLFGVLFPLAVNFVAVMAPSETATTLMVYSFVLIPCTALMLLDCHPETKGGFRYVKRGVSVVTAAVLTVGVIGYAYTINVSYTVMHYATKQTENYYDSLITQVRMTEGYTASKKWAFIGKISDPLLDSYWESVPVYGGCLKTKQLLNSYSRFNWINGSNGYNIPMATYAQINEVKQTEEYKAMPCWPSQGSIKVIGDVVVIKCKNQ